MRKKSKNTTKETFAREIRDLLALSNKHIDIRASKDYKVVTAIIDSMKDALLRGEKIHIRGFGIFRAKTLPPKKRMCGYFYKPRNKHPYQILETTPSRTYIHFYPSRVLKRLVNEENNQ